MIFEYALAPDLVVDWAVNGEGQYVPMFGLDTRRLVSDYPRDWKGEVYGNALGRYNYDYGSLEFQNVQPILDAYLQLLTDHMVPRGGSLREGESWIDGALREHRTNPFHAIIASAAPEGASAEFLTPAAFRDVRNTLWWLPSIPTTQKTAAAIARALGPILKLSSRIIIIDPHLSLDKQRYRSSFAELLRVALEGPRCVAGMPEIRLIAGIEHAFRPPGTRDEASEQRFAANLIARCQAELPRLMTRGCSAHLTILKEKSGGDALHNRFLLTDVGGVIIPYGIDDFGDERDRAVDDDIQPMLRAIYERRWRQYTDLTEFEIVVASTQIDGTH